ncbi:MAG: caspase domain-containing protein [Chitinophagales bacterium]
MTLDDNSQTADTDIFFEPSQLKVLIVGTLQWADAYNLPPFSKYHRKDQELERTLREFGVPEENIVALYDQDATLVNIYAALDSISAQSDEETRFMFYFCGHGFNGWFEDAGSVYFANYDIEYYQPKETGFNVNFITEHMSSFKGSHVLLTADCCKSGGLMHVADAFAAMGKKAMAITSCSATDWSTGNWTFTQKIIEALQGDALIDMNSDGTISFNEMVFGIQEGLKYTDRQKPGVVFYNFSDDAYLTSRKGASPAYGSLNAFSIGQYVFAKHNNNFFPAQIIGDRDDSYLCRFYNYSDYEEWYVAKNEVKVPYFVQYAIGENIYLDNFKLKPGVVLDTDNNGFYYLKSTEGDQTLWLSYERILTDSEIQVQILNENGDWQSGQVLEQKDNLYYITYSNRGFQWDEWVSAERIQF